MARRLPKEEPKSAKATLDSILDSIVSEYGQLKDKLTKIKEDCDKFNQDIKETMEENDIREFSSSDGYKVKYVVSEKETMNEEKLIDILSTKHKELSNTLGLVKMKPYVDFDAIEKEVYNGNIPEDVMKDIGTCKETKEIVSLRLSKEKKK